jgi:hypothetical protein
MKAIWRANPYGATWPPWDKLNSRGVTDIYFAARKIDLDTGKYVRNNLQLTPAYATGVRSHNLGYRIFRDPSWDSISDPVVLVDGAVSDILAVDPSGGYVPYMFDIEYHNPAFVAETLRRFRQKFPRGPVAWTLEPLQGGWFTADLVKVLNNDPNLVVVPQAFYGNMAPADVPPYSKLKNDIVSRGVKANRVKVFYDGAKSLPPDWDGCILSEERLP